MVIGLLLVAMLAGAAASVAVVLTGGGFLMALAAYSLGGLVASLGLGLTVHAVSRAGVLLNLRGLRDA